MTHMSSSALLLILLPFTVFLLIGMPIAFVLIATSVIYVVAKGIPLSLLAHRMCFSLDSFPLLAIPLFILAGKLMNTGGISNRIFRFANSLVGHIRGGLGHVNVVASVIFAGMSGTALADVGGLGEIELKAMTEAGYDRKFSSAVTLASATIGPIIPPSVPLVIYGVLAEVPVTRLFLGGFLPGIVMAAVLMLAIYFYAKKRNYPTSQRASLKELALSFLDALPAMLSPLIIILGLTTGIFSPTEAAGIAVVYALILGGLIYRELKLSNLITITKEVVESTTMVMFVIASALLFSWVISAEQIPQMIAQSILSIGNTPVKFLILVNLLLLILGMFMENNAIMLLMIPILVPAAITMGISPVHLGIVMVLNITTGLLTPPVGLALYMMKDMTGLSFEDTVKGILPFLIPLLISLFIITFNPDIVLFVPNLILGK